MSDQIPIPNIPGYVSNRVNKDAYHKNHIFDVIDGLPVVDKSRHVISKPSMLPTIPTDNKFYGYRKNIGIPSQSTIPNTVNILPKWLAYDKKVLRFWCYFTEEVHFSNDETNRHRIFTLYYYLDDDTLSISEEKIANCGMPQGAFLKRQQVQLGNEDRFINWVDIKVSSVLKICGRDFNVMSCDTQTQEFYERMNIVQIENQDLPKDSYIEKREAAEEIRPSDNTISSYVEARCGRLQHWQLQKTKQFFALDERVLRFWAIWNDPRVYGGTRRFQVLYYLADDSIAIYEDYPENAGVYPFPKFLSRCRLPKTRLDKGVALIGTDHTDQDDFVSYEDLMIGTYLSVYNRHILLVRADSYTMEFYKDMLSMTDEDFEPILEDATEFVIPKVSPPPHNGYGTEEDSLASVKNLIPRVPRKNFHKLLKYDSAVLRFKAKVITISKLDEDRRFVIEFYRSDDTIKIFECRSANSGFVGGKFLERSRLKNPTTSEYFIPSEFFVGADVCINGFNFHLLEADKCTMDHMSGEPHLFAHADVERILHKLADILWDRSCRRTDTFRLVDRNHDSRITEDEFEEMLTMYGWNLSKHEILTLWRHYDDQNEGFITCNKFLNVLEKYKHHSTH